jgi:diguanylate cyclase (GGDEF)-like protein
MDKLLHYVVDKINIGVIVIDRDLKIVLWNGWLERVSGMTRQQTVGKVIGEVCPRFAEKNYLNILNMALFNGQSRFCSGTLHKAFVTGPDDINRRSQQNMQVEPVSIDGDRLALIQITDISGHYKRVNHLKNMLKEIGLEYQQIKISEKISRHQALHDALTGLPNRVLFNDRIIDAVDFAQRNSCMFAVMFLDLDGFKEVNDSYGHHLGDQLLQMVVGRLKIQVRDTDTLARFGGDEFVLLLPQIKDKKDAATVAKKLIRAFKLPFRVDELIVHISVSIGISVFPQDSESPTTWLIWLTWPCTK